jgi:RNA polymerase sigma factor (sigma-70 family)
MRAYANQRSHEPPEILQRDLKRLRISPEEEQSLAVRAKAGDKEAREALILSHLRLVVAATRGISHIGLDFDDLLQQGNMSLIEAVDRFEPGGCKLSTFATKRILWQLMKTAFMADLPVSPPSYIAPGPKARKRFMDRIRPFRNPRRVGRLNPNGVLLNDPPVPVEADGLQADELAKLLKVLAVLSPLRRRIVELNFGIGCEPLAHPAIGKIIGMSADGVRKHLLRALSLMRIAWG